MVLKRVKQAHSFGCFVAAVATALGVTYKQALKAVYPKRVASGRKFNPAFGAGWDIGRALCRAGLTIKFTNARRIQKMKWPAILIISWKDFDTGHCVVWDSKQKVVLDSAYDPPLPIAEYESQLAKVVYFSRRRSTRRANRRPSASRP